MINIISISHNDLDGVGSTIALEQFIEENKNDFMLVEKHNIGNHLTDKLIYDKVVEYKACANYLILVTDLSVTDETAAKIDVIIRDGADVEIAILDHHKTANHLNQYLWADVLVEVDGVKQSGTSLLESYWHNLGYEMSEPLRHFIEAVRLYDTWDWTTCLEDEGKLAKNLNDLFYMLGRQKFSQEMRTLFDEALNYDREYITLAPSHHILLETERHRIEKYIHHKDKNLVKRTAFFGPNGIATEYTYGAVVVEQYHSEVGNVICDTHPDIDFIMMFDVANKKLSLRSKNTDVSAIAQSFGGGGHTLAAGASLSQELQKIYFPEMLPKKGA